MVAGREVEQVDLEERIARLALALKDEALAVGAEIAFSGAFAGEGKLPHAGEERRLGIAPRVGLGGADRGRAEHEIGRDLKNEGGASAFKAGDVHGGKLP